MLSVGRFNAHFSAKDGVGQNLLWLRASLCPCRSPTSGQAKPGCPLCKAKGVFWAPPMPAWSAVAGMKSTREWAAFGEYQAGDMVMSIPSDSPFYGAGEFDRCIMIDSSEPFNAVLTRGSERISYPVVSIESVFWINTATAQIVQGATPPIAPDGAFYWAPRITTEVGFNIELEQGGFLVGDSDVNSPPTDTQYSLKGRKRPEYYIYKDFPQDRAHYAGAALPRRVVARRFDLFGR